MKQKILLKYFADLLLKSKTIIGIIVFNILVLLALPLIMFFNSLNVDLMFKENTMIFIAVPMLLLIFYLIGAIFVLFVNTKKNNVDLYIYIKSFKKTHIIWFKELIIWILGLHLLIGQLFGGIVMLSLGLNVSTFFIFFAGLMLSILLISAILIICFSVIPIFAKFMTSLTMLFGIGFIIIIGSIMPLVLEKANVINANFDLKENQKNLVKIYNLDNNKNVKDVNYGLFENPLANNKNSIDGWKPSSIANYSPLNIIWGFAPHISALDNTNLNLTAKITANNSLSSSYLDLKTSFINKDLFADNFIVTGFNATTIYDFKDKSEIFSAISEALTSNDYIKEKINDSEFWKKTTIELINQNIWDSNLNLTLQRMISHLLGLQDQKSILFNVFNDYNLIETKIEGIYNYLTNKYNEDFSQFVKYIWTDKNVQRNIYSFDALGSYDELNQYHPILKSYDNLEIANQYDIDFIKNKFFNVIENEENQITKIQVLSKNQEKYLDLNFEMPTSEFLNNLEINDLSSFNNYIDQNSNINTLEFIMKQASAYTNEPVYKMSFRNNVNNYLLISQKLNISEKSKFPLQWLYFLIFINFAIFLEIIKAKKVSKGDFL